MTEEQIPPDEGQEEAGQEAQTEGAEQAPDEGQAQAAAQAREQFYQTAYQRLVSGLRDDGVPEEQINQMKAQAKAPAVPDGEEKQLMDMTASELTGQLTSSISRATEAAINEMRSKETISREQTEATQTVVSLANSMGLNEAELGAAIKEARVYGIDTGKVGGPRRFGMAVADKIKSIANAKAFHQGTAAAQARAADQGRDFALTTQPGKAAAPESAKKRTPEQKALDEMYAAVPRSSRSLLDSERGQ